MLKVVVDDKEKYAIRFIHLQVHEGLLSETTVFLRSLLIKKGAKSDSRKETLDLLKSH